jgi:hypothetical protein
MAMVKHLDRLSNYAQMAVPKLCNPDHFGDEDINCVYGPSTTICNVQGTFKQGIFVNSKPP